MDNTPQVTPTTNGSSNGHINLDAVAEALQNEVTVGYRPIMPLEALWMSGGDMPQITLRRDLEFMQMHPIVMIALEYYKSGIAGAEFWGGPDFNNPDNEKGKPISTDPRVAEFVMAHVERFWQRGVPLLQEGGYPYGWAPGEHMYKEVNIDNANGKKMLVWSHLKTFHPNDGFLLTLKYQPVGVRVKNIREKMPIDLHFASESIPAKACWYAHRPRFNTFYGRSQLIGAWRPWRRLGFRDGVEQVIDAAIYRAGYVGPIISHPQEDMQTSLQGVPATSQDSRGMPRRSARDVARQMVEWAKAGAGFTKSSAKYPQAQGGGDKWTIEFPDHVMDVSPLINAAEYLEKQIMLGIGVPPELIMASDTGSGYSGRSIPREAFMDQQQKVADAILQLFVEQVVKPLVLWNFGDVPFEISCKSLLKTQSDDKQGEEQQQGQEQGGGGQEPPMPDSQQPPEQPKPNGAQPPQPAAMSLSERDKVLAIVRKALKRAS